MMEHCWLLDGIENAKSKLVIACYWLIKWVLEYRCLPSWIGHNKDDAKYLK
jgi:hypothetical protein